VQALALEDLGEIRRELKLVEQRLRAHEKKQQQFYGKLFAKLGDNKSGAGALYTPEEIAAANKPVFKKCNLWYALSEPFAVTLHPTRTTACRLNFLVCPATSKWRRCRWRGTSSRSTARRDTLSKKARVNQCSTGPPSMAGALSTLEVPTAPICPAQHSHGWARKTPSLVLGAEMFGLAWLGWIPVFTPIARWSRLVPAVHFRSLAISCFFCFYTSLAVQRCATSPLSSTSEAQT
jgi:hypothetical protein